MSKKTTSAGTQSQQQTFNYDGNSWNKYQTGINNLFGNNGAMTALLKNPFGNPFYNQTLRQGMNQANRAGATSMQNMLQGLQQRGIANGSPAAAYLTALQGRNNSALQANAFNTAQNQAAGMYGMAANMINSFRPLQTGGSSSGQNYETQKVGGTGTWLPQVAGIALGGITGGLAGGLTGALGGMSGAMGGSNPFAQNQTSSPQMGSMTNMSNMSLYPNYNQSSYTPMYSNPFGGPSVGYNSSPYVGAGPWPQ